MDVLGERLRAGGNVLARRDNRDIAGSLDRRLRDGRLVSPLPGVYQPPGLSDDQEVAARAALAWAGPGAVLTGLAAARATYWPKAPRGPVTLALPTTTKRSTRGVEVERRRIPPELVLQQGDRAVTQPWATAVDLASGPHGGPAIDEALRTGPATLAQMWEALQLQPGRPGNRLREALLHDSRDEPWSEAERDGHRLLRAAGITGWKANQWVAGYWVDVLFAQHGLILEIDGWASHGARQAFEDDRYRRNMLVLAGYRVLNFTWRQLQDEPAWVLSCIRRALSR